ncbi:MAG: polysaccharide deacetylase family protein [Antricoccus sp.]
MPSTAQSPTPSTAQSPTSSSAESSTSDPSAASSSTPAEATSEDPGQTAASSTSPDPAPAGPTTALPQSYQHPMGWSGGGKVLSLTFDDGPGPRTSQVLDILDKYGIKATFCMIGKQVSSYAAVAQRIVSSGDQLRNHS